MTPEHPAGLNNKQMRELRKIKREANSGRKSLSEASKAMRRVIAEATTDQDMAEIWQCIMEGAKNGNTVNQQMVLDRTLGKSPIGAAGTALDEEMAKVIWRRAESMTLDELKQVYAAAALVSGEPTGLLPAPYDITLSATTSTTSAPPAPDLMASAPTALAPSPVAQEATGDNLYLSPGDTRLSGDTTTLPSTLGKQEPCAEDSSTSHVTT